jgi:3,4-dihydroxy 2-butanone 4-phosphate synthase/GTP cyclohydrolase II
MARLPDLIEFAQRHGLKIGAIADLIHYRSRTERLVERVGERPIHTAEGDFRLVVFRDKLSDATHLALTLGEITSEHDTLVRVHEPLSVIDLLDHASRRHSWTIPAALGAIRRAGCGVLVLLHRPESAQELPEASEEEAEVRRRHALHCGEVAEQADRAAKTVGGEICQREDLQYPGDAVPVNLQ